MSDRTVDDPANAGESCETFIDRLCDRFEDRWRNGGRPEIESFLTSAEPAVRPRLFRELLAVELELRLRRGESPSQAEYSTRFPDQTEVVDQVFQSAVDATVRPGAPGGDNTQLSGAKTVAAPTEAINIVGQRFGDYELLEEIARGGMGVVYQARQVSLNRVVALKMILAGQWASEAERRRFHSEAEAAAKLDHPNIVPVFEVGQFDGRHYFSMSFIDGTSLSAMVRQGPLPPREAARMMRQVADAIQYAHDRGIIHRDLKPANILIDKHGQPRVMDFGLAKDLSSDGLTATGELLGTPSYMAPEQAGGNADQIGKHTDVYALGATLYCLLSGRPPFQAATPAETMWQVMQREPVSLTALNAAIPRDLGTICSKCLDKDPQRRYESAGEVAKDLDRFLRGEPIHARSVNRFERTWRWCKRNPVVAALMSTAALSLLAGSIVSTIFGIQATRNAERERAASAEARRNLAGLYEDRGLAAMSQGGHAEAALWFVKAIEANETDTGEGVETDRFNRIRLANSLRMAPKLARHVPLENGAQGGAEIPADGRSLLIAKQNSCQLFSLASGDFTDTNPILSLEAVGDAHFCANGERLIAFGDDRQVRFFNAADGSPVGKPLPFEELWNTAINFDGHLIAIATKRDQEFGVALWDVDSGSKLPFSCPTVDGTSLQFLAATNRLKVQVQDGSQVWDTSAGQPLGLLTHPRGASCLLSPDGTRAATWQSLSNIVTLWDTTSFEPVQTIEMPVGTLEFNVLFSPDGGRLLLVDGNKGILRLCDARTGVLIDEAVEPRCAGWDGPVFSPSGKYFVHWGESPECQVRNATTGETVGERLIFEDAVEAAIFSADDRRLITRTANSIHVWEPTTGRLWTKMLAASGPRGVVLSPNGKWLGLSTVESVQIWDLHNDAADGRTLAGPFDSFAISAYAFAHGMLVLGSHQGAVRVWDVEQKKTLLEFAAHDGPISTIDISPDGSQFATGSWDQSAKVWQMESGNPSNSPLLHRAPVTRVGFSSNGQSLFTAAANVAQVWDLKTHERGGPELVHQEGVLAAAFDPSGEQLIVGDYGGDCIQWNIRNGTPVSRFTHERLASVGVVEFDREAKSLLVGGRDGGLFDFATGEPRPELLSHGARIVDAAFSPDGTWIATAASDGTARVWDAATGRPQSSIMRHYEMVTAVEFSRDGRSLLTASLDGSTVLWDAQTGDALSLPFEQDAPVIGAFFSNNDQTIHTISVSGVNAWDAARPVERRAKSLGADVESLVATHIDEGGAVQPSATFGKASNDDLIATTNSDAESTASETSQAGQFATILPGSWTCPVLPDADISLVRWSQKPAPFDVDAYLRNRIETNAKSREFILAVAALRGLIWSACFSVDSQSDYESSRKLSTDPATLVSRIASGKDLSAEELQLLDAVLEQARPALDKLAALAADPDWVVVHGRARDAERPDLEEMRQVVGLLILRAYQQLRNGAPDASLDSIEQGLKLSRHIRATGPFATQSFCNFLDVLLVHFFARQAAATSNEAELRRILNVIDEHRAATAESGTNASRWAYISMRQLLEDLQAGIDSQAEIASVLGLPELQTISIHELRAEADGAIESAADWYHVAASAGQAPFTHAKSIEHQNKLGSTATQWARLVQALKPSMNDFLESSVRLEAEMSGATAITAIKLFEVRNGTLPTSLEAAVTLAGLNATPNDPYTDEAFRFVSQDGTATVYSVGGDLEDDGGTDWNEDTKRGDLVFRLPKKEAESETRTSN